MASKYLGSTEAGSAAAGGRFGSGKDAEDDVKEVWDKNKTAFSSKRSSEYYDPCQEFANRSIRCMHRNAGDKDMCQDYFQAYRDCKKEWTTRRRTGKGPDDA